MRQLHILNEHVKENTDAVCTTEAAESGERRLRAAGGRCRVIFFSSSALPRSSGTHTVKPPELCTSERPAEKMTEHNLI